MQAFGALAITLIRHYAAVVAAWIGATAATTGAEISPEIITGMEGEITAGGIALMMALYVSVEKALKPVFLRFERKD